MAKFDIFVGRKEELDLIDSWAEKWGETHLIAVQGDGGVGKTWLLYNILRRYSERDDLIVVYVDAAEQPYGAQYMAQLLVRSLGPENFPRMLDEMENLTQSYYERPHLDHLAREREILELGVEEVNHLLRDKRLIYLGDTLELWDPGSKERRPSRDINVFAHQFANALFVSAGRDVQERMPGYREDFGDDRVTCLELHNFDQIESAEFFEAVDTEGFISHDMRAKLHFLTDGRPVLLSLAAEWLSRDVPLPDIAERSMEELEQLPEQELQELRQGFEFELVDRVRKLREPLDRAVLYMAHTHRRCDDRLLSLMLETSQEDGKELMEQMAELSFVRHNPATGNCMLHDEMRLLVNKHAWPYVDPKGTVRQELTRKIISGYYEPRIKELAEQVKAQLEPDKGPVGRATISQTEWEQWRLEAECLYYYLQLAQDEGVSYFDRRFADASRNNHLMRMQFLLNEMEMAGHVDIRQTLELRRAESLRSSGDTDQAEKICRTLLKQADLSVDNRITAHNLLGVIAAATDPDLARQEYESALQLAQEGDDSWKIGELQNNLGQLYRLTSQLDQATQHYQQAIEHSKQAGNQPLVASATNNLAYVYRLQGDLLQADALCRAAMARRKQLGLERDLAYSYLTKGEIDRDKGDLESAERYTKLALRSFDKVEEVRGQAMAYRSLGNIRRHMEQYDDAEAYLEKGIKLAEQINDEPLLADLLSVYGREQRDRAVYLQGLAEGQEVTGDLMRNAVERLERSVELASGYGDQWLITRGRFELALAHFFNGSLPDEQVTKLLEEVWAQASQLDDVLLQGYIEETRGEIAQRQGDLSAAAEYYGRAADLVAQRRGREASRFFDRIGDRLLDLQLSDEEAGMLARGLLAETEGVADDDPRESLRMLSRQVLDMRGV